MVAGSFADGLIVPLMISASALPTSWPANQHCTTASVLLSQGMVIEPPVWLTRTVLADASATIEMRSFCLYFAG